jgi:hypothetical protein
VDQPGGDHGCHREVGGDDRLDGEQRKAPQRDELGDESDQVEGEAGDEAPLVQHPQHQAGVDPPQRGAAAR